MNRFTVAVCKILEEKTSLKLSISGHRSFVWSIFMWCFIKGKMVGT